MAIDRQSIEKQDFPLARRGYDAAAVKAHLSAIAAEVEELRSGTTASESLAGTASKKVRAIIEAAEATAAQIRADAEQQAGRIVSEARSDAQATQASAAAQAGVRVEQVSEAAVAMLERIEAIGQELSPLLDALRAGATHVNAELAQLRDAVQGAGESAAGGPPPATVTEPKSAARPEPEPEASARAAAPAGAGNEEAARLIALNMALNGSSHDEIDRYLNEHYALSNQATLLEEVFASVDS